MAGAFFGNLSTCVCNHVVLTNTSRRLLIGAGLVVFAVLLGLFITPTPAELDDDADPFTGRWLINGIDPIGEEYAGTLTITSTGIDQYQLSWIITGSLLDGTGKLEGNELVAEYVVGANDRTGTATYEIVDGLLAGALSLDGVEGVGTEEGFPPR